METSISKIDKYVALQKLEMCIEVFDTPMARECENKALDAVLFPAILKANADLGYNANEDKLTHLFANISEEVKNSVPNIRLGEIPIAIHKGVLGDLGEFQGLSVVTVIKFLKAHYTSGKRAEIAKLRSVEEEEKPIPTKEEQKELAKGHLIEAFERFKTKGDLGYSGVYLYRWLNEDFKLITFTNDVKWKIYYQAIVSILGQKETGLIKNFMTVSPNRKEIKLLKQYLEKFKDEKECAKQVAMNIPNEELFISIRNEAERISVVKFFRDCIEMEVELKDLLNDTD
ncbi:hypothetical protein G5B30_16670 [Sphingobacterium sp. SGG-5]|uniref:hypothetical protein n=1 Tax=Sphingobacterium sp. SGG-5 TaxID=2710881 RepID=UPI0013EC7127|nr:hypothetical protein [Sphingobacterium sp. SGG-5]NGM63545.1 hypothetical protein [Sphingobacterium sp. SGG-5]